MDLERQLVETNSKSDFLETLDNFIEIYKGIDNTSKIDQLNTIKKVYANDHDIEKNYPKLKILSFNGINELDTISFLFKKELFDVIRVINWDENSYNYNEFDFILIDWNYSDFSWPYIINQITDRSKIILFNVPSSIQTDCFFDYGISLVVKKDCTPQEALKNTIKEYLSFGLKKNYFNEKKKFLNFCYAKNLEPLKIQLGKCRNICKKFNINTIDLFESEYYLVINEVEKAKKIAESYFERFGDDSWVLEILGRIYLKIGDKDKAIPILERVIYKSPQDIDILCRVSEGLAENGNEQLSYSYLDRANKIDYNSLKVSECKLKNKILFSDRENVKNLLDTLPNLNRVVSYLNNLAISYAFTGDFQKSLALYNDAIIIVGSYDKNFRNIISYNVAICHLRANDYQSALNILETHLSNSSTLSEKMSQLKANIEKFYSQGMIDDLYKYFCIDKEKQMVGKIEKPLSSKDFQSFNLRGMFFPRLRNGSRLQ